MNAAKGAERAAELARMLADPLRLRLLQVLMPGAAPVSALVTITGASQSKVSNHLKILRDAAMVRADRRGRHVTYEVADGDIAQVVQLLTSVAGQPPADYPPSGALAEARTCYDHLAGRFGVALFDALVAREAVMAPDDPWGEVEPGPAAHAILEGLLRLDLKQVARDQGRRRFAYCCPDWSAGRLHLGGALAAAILARFIEAGWLDRDVEGTRAVHLTAEGREIVARLGAIDLD